MKTMKPVDSFWIFWLDFCDGKTMTVWMGFIDRRDERFLYIRSCIIAMIFFLDLIKDVFFEL